MAPSRLPKFNIERGLRGSTSNTTLIKITDELLYYAHEVERRDPFPECCPALVAVLDKVDRVNRHHTSRSMHDHWTHLRDSLNSRGYDQYLMGGKYNFLALAVQSRLTQYVRAKLDADPGKLAKAGRPLLNYSLRPRRVTPMHMLYHSQRDDPVIDIEMVKMPLDRGLDPNQKIHLNNGRTVWALFLLPCLQSTRIGEGSSSIHMAWYQSCELMVQHGASSDCWFHDKAETPLTVSTIFREIFDMGQLS